VLEEDLEDSQGCGPLIVAAVAVAYAARGAAPEAGGGGAAVGFPGRDLVGEEEGRVLGGAGQMNWRPSLVIFAVDGA